MSKDKKEDVYDSLREKITTLSLYPGQELNVEELCSLFQVSRSPLRDALLRLERDRLVDIFPQRGTRVSYLDEDIIEEERYMRKCMELGALKRALSKERSNKEKEAFVSKLESILLMQKAYILEDNLSSFYTSDDELHHLFQIEAGLLNVWKIISAHTGNDKRIRILSFSDKTIVSSVLDEHKAIVDAIKEGKNDLAVELDEKHLAKVNKEMKELKMLFPSYFI